MSVLRDTEIILLITHQPLKPNWIYRFIGTSIITNGWRLKNGHPESISAQTWTVCHRCGARIALRRCATVHKGTPQNTAEYCCLKATNSNNLIHANLGSVRNDTNRASISQSEKCWSKNMFAALLGVTVPRIVVRCYQYRASLPKKWVV